MFGRVLLYTAVPSDTLFFSSYCPRRSRKYVKMEQKCSLSEPFHDDKLYVCVRVRVWIAKNTAYFWWMSKHSCDNGLCQWSIVACVQLSLASYSIWRRCWNGRRTARCRWHSRHRPSNYVLHGCLHASPVHITVSVTEIALHISAQHSSLAHKVKTNDNALRSSSAIPIISMLVGVKSASLSVPCFIFYYGLLKTAGARVIKIMSRAYAERNENVKVSTRAHVSLDTFY